MSSTATTVPFASSLALDAAADAEIGLPHPYDDPHASALSFADAKDGPALLVMVLEAGLLRGDVGLNLMALSALLSRLVCITQEGGGACTDEPETIALASHVAGELAEAAIHVARMQTHARERLFARAPSRNAAND